MDRPDHDPPADFAPAAIRDRVVAIIPARGGSRGLPRKNLALVGGRTLLQRAIGACLATPSIGLVAVTTDDDEIAADAVRAGAAVVRRPADLASDTATSESALFHAVGALRARGHTIGVVVFVQCTSPFIDPGDLERAVATVAGRLADVVFSAVASHDFLWRVGDDGATVGVNHDPRVRERRQDRPAELRETGAFYVMAAEGFVAAAHRFFGRTVALEVDAAHAIDVDTEHDLLLARRVAPMADRPAPARQGGPPDVQLLVTDFDGVHTDDRVVVFEDGSEAVVANRRDGHGVAMLRRAGIDVVVLSTERNPVVAARARKLGVPCLHGIDDKWPALAGWLTTRQITPAQVAYVGNDINDLDCMAQVGWPVAVADAHPTVREAAAYVTFRAGGDGAVREVAELLLASANSGVDRRPTTKELA